MARLLLDTHLVLWWIADHPQLPKAAVGLIRDPENEVHVSQVSLWELAIKASVGRLDVDLAKLERTIPAQGFRWLAIRNQHLLAVAELGTSPVHRDPFDRLLVAQSRSEPLRLLTADRQLAAYGPTVTVF
ncbi:type II toxin-antitoxin system VapC family toxin [Synechococcus sp. CS-602]|uniref:type II toxin-antitoxin system VapC family toxin n=1 Tax=Synechococcaceae TaxID=1890426 RepID=UPI0008FF0FEF|nr:MULTISPECIES: type II toxin-antitoxin system VapC family toxin [Synechococcaceae]MCT4365402.1 type II toxin-antitoxin system VapC family toxin [Candidatus Regnicoccus frigidus MAG-AL1]APD47558.1 PIN domain-containing protein [Synechococcus sp. SynAce01]MCT0202466.1 type II toxin-antitoxin system VapC family toxin [Synechococcus sp. CS-603]MCT0204272.1 type II toxin-antitoxin system VapC family toxin [Synechococcus sp. CS-602]MCT0247113.1 type II toxin-antitoxin system VapC family toxin [Syn